MSIDESDVHDTPSEGEPETEEESPAVESATEVERRPAWLTNPVYMVLAVAVFAVLIGVTLAIIRNRDSGQQLLGPRMTLELSYPVTAEPAAIMDGQAGAAPSGALITCRTATQPNLRLGEGTAAADGSFRIELDPSPWPLDSLGSDLFNQLNSSIECRAGTGEWVRPLRPPRVSVA